MKKIIFLILFISLLLFTLCYQSVLINREISKKPFITNLYISVSNVKKESSLHDGHSGYYVKKINDSINIYHEISDSQKVISTAWQLKYQNMSPKSLLSILDNHNLFLFTKLDNEDNLFNQKVIFINNKTKQFLVGFYEKESYYLRYSHPRKHIPKNERNNFITQLKELLIGAPY